MPLSNYLKIYPAPDKPGYLVIFSTRRAALVLVPESTLEAIETGTLAAANRDTLTRLGILVSDPAAEQAEMRNFHDNINLANRNFNAMVVLNLDCNLACAYCYEGAIRGNRYMSPETADTLVKMIERDHIPRGGKISLDFYGGEALLSIGLIRKISRRLTKAAQQTGSVFSFNLVTNGTLLTRPVARELAGLGLKGVKVTLDGPREIHDRFRPYISGLGTFAPIIRNLKAVWDIVDAQIGGNYSIDTYREFPRLLDHLLAEGLTPDRVRKIKFDPIIKGSEKLPLPDYKGGCDTSNEPWLMEAGIFLREEILKRGYNTPRVIPAACMIESANDLVVNYDGAIYKCPAFLGRGEMKIGDLRHGTTDFRESHNLDSWKKQECLDCAYLPLCFGGCRFLRLLRDGNIDDVDCRKSYLDANLEKFILQDLKYRPRKQ
jgi:uncharacterized protein